MVIYMLQKILLRQPAMALAIILLAVMWPQNSHAASHVYDTVADNPKYEAVTKLKFKEADKKVTYGEDPNQYGLLWLANNSDNNSYKSDILVIFIHGGCWLTYFDISHTYAATTAMAQAGYNVWSLEYRRTGESGGGWPTTFEDIKKGIAASSNLAEHGVKPSQIIIAGHSAGGHLAILSGAHIDQILPDNEATISIAGLAAITDMNTYASSEGSCQSAGAKFMGGLPAEFPEQYAKANPINYEIKLETMLFQGRKDPIVPTEQAEALKNGISIQSTYVDLAGHFDWVHPGTPAFRKFLDYLKSKVQK